MPQPLRATIGFTEEAIERLHHLTELTGNSQRDVICALLMELDDDKIFELVLNYQKRKQALKLAKALKLNKNNLTLEKLEKLKSILNYDE